MPIVNATQDQQTHDNTNSTIIITSPDRNPQADCSLILPSTTNPPVTTDESLKLAPKKEEVPVTTEEIVVPQPEVTGILKSNFLLILKAAYGDVRLYSVRIEQFTIVITDGDQCKPVMKEEEAIVPKVEEKQCNNPLAGLANAVNAITNGVVGDESPTIPISMPVTANSKQAPPKAMVKPQVLTHVIEGFVIQEGNIYNNLRFSHISVFGLLIFTLFRTSCLVFVKQRRAEFLSYFIIF